MTKMTEYSERFRQRMVRRMTGPKAVSATGLAAEVGVRQSTLSRWLREASKVGTVPKEKPAASAAAPRRPSDWSPEEKLRALVASASLSDAELGGWLRREGLQEEDLARFRAEALAGMASPKSGRSGGADQKRIKELERDLKRKDAALAEAAALLVLRKKANALWGGEGEDT